MTKEFFHNTFSSLKIRNYRIYYIGQAISVSGSLLQAFAQDWLVLKLTNSGTMLGVVLFFQFFPMLVFSYYGGALADKYQKLRILYATTIAAIILAFGLGALVLTGVVQIWMVLAFALLSGIVMAVENPVRLSFMYEMVGRDQVKNAISLWTVLISLARIAGPALAGILIATLGIGECFTINAVSYIAVLIALFLVDTRKLHPSAAYDGKINLKEEMKYIYKNSAIFVPLIMMTIIGTITFEWQASLPLMAKFVFNGDAKTYSVISVALSVGMLVGGFVTATSKKISVKIISLFALFFGVATLLVSISPTVAIASIFLAIAGFFAVSFANTTNSILQINSDQKMRGRIMALWSAAFLGQLQLADRLLVGLVNFLGQDGLWLWAGLPQLLPEFTDFTL